MLGKVSTTFLFSGERTWKSSVAWDFPRLLGLRHQRQSLHSVTSSRGVPDILNLGHHQQDHDKTTIQNTNPHYKITEL